MESPLASGATGSRAAVSDALRRHIQTALHLGTLRPGDRLASTRQVARELRAGPRAVMAAYRLLADEGLVCLRPRSGVFVSADTLPAEPLPPVADWLLDVLLRGLTCGVSPAEVRRQARLLLDGRRPSAACVECNGDQLHALCRQLRDDYEFTATAVDLGALARGEPLPARAAAADLVVTTRFHAAEAGRLARRLRRPALVATLDTAFVQAVRRMMDGGPVWWLCTDPRFAAKLPLMWPGASINPLVIGEPGGVPDGARVYATRAAAERLSPEWRGRVVTIPRVFSAETARALLSFRVRRTLDGSSSPLPDPTAALS
jgi:DNA-binding transcriptional regulator YhcF (GntR family)